MKLIKPSRVNGSAFAPPSKSAMQRALALSLLAKGKSVIKNPSFCDDAIAAANICRALGAKVEKVKGEVHVACASFSKGGAIDCGESGLSSRMFTPICALSEEEFTITGRGSLLSRPMDLAQKPLAALGVKTFSQNGLLPLKVQGPLQGGKVSVDGSVSSQFLTGLLIALPLCKKDSVVNVSDLKSREYIDLTVDAIFQFGGKVSNSNYKTFTIRGGQSYKPTKFYVEGDWSGASFLLVAGAIAGNVTVKGISISSSQPDRKIIDALRLAGAKISIKGDTIKCEKGDLSGFEFDATNCPDLFPPLVALACYCKGETLLHGAKRLKHKESDRAAALEQEFRALGADISVQGNTIKVSNRGLLKGGNVSSHGDHRMAMSCAIAALSSQNGVTIDDERCVSKSYPEFFDVLEKLVVK